jgi:2-isopropylmalate synthase
MSTLLLGNAVPDKRSRSIFERAKAELTEGERSKLVAFGSTRRKHVRAEDDGQVRALLNSLAPAVCLVAKAHSLQVQQVLQASLEENLNMIRNTVSFLTRQHSRTVLVDLVHFFDGYAHDPGYALQCCQAAADAGAACASSCATPPAGPCRGSSPNCAATPFGRTLPHTT